MAHFAELDDNNKVLRVIVVSNNDCGNLEFPESEPIGQTFLESLGLIGVWKQTSYTSNFRQHYAGTGAVYVQENDMFTTPQPYPSWTLDSNHEWQAPVSRPEQDGWWEWNEAEQKWQR